MSVTSSYSSASPRFRRRLAQREAGPARCIGSCRRPPPQHARADRRDARARALDGAGAVRRLGASTSCRCCSGIGAGASRSRLATARTDVSRWSSLPASSWPKPSCSIGVGLPRLVRTRTVDGRPTGGRPAGHSRGRRAVRVERALSRRRRPIRRRRRCHCSRRRIRWASIASLAAGRDDLTLLSEIHVPVDRPVVMELTSKDVIHSFGVRAMRVKQDVSPVVAPRLVYADGQGEFEIVARSSAARHHRMRGT